METRERRRRGIVGPIILIAIGLIFLLSNMGLLGWSVWEVLFRLWPVILIALGLEVLIGRRSVFASVAVLAITGAIVGAALYFMPLQSSSGDGATSETISQPLQGARQANISIAFGMGSLRLGALPDANSLIQGIATGDGGEQLTQSFQVTGDTAYYQLGTRDGGQGLPFPRGGSGRTWDLKVNSAVPTQLRVDGGVGNSDLDLSQLHITSLDARFGVGKSTITMPSSGHVQATINGGVGDVDVAIPSGMEARIQANTGIGGVNIPSTYQRQDNTYTSPGYETAQNRLDLTVKGGVGRITVR
jgi:hypothetical protein